MTKKPVHTIDLMVVTAALALAAWVTWAVGPKTYDDAYITFRYARNLALGHGFVYNPGDNILGTTTPLLTLLLAALGRLGSVEAIPAISQAISGAALFSGGVLAYLLGRDHGQRVAGVVAGLALLINPVLIDTWGGEALLLLALVLAAFYAYHRGSTTWPAIFTALAFLTRGEGILVGVVIYGHYVLTRKKIPWAGALAFSAVLLPWLIFSMAVFGSPLPGTLAAKIAQRQSGFWPPFLLTSLEWLAAHITPTPHFSHLGPNYGYGVAAILAAVGGLGLMIRPEFAGCGIVIWVGLYTAGYTVMDIPFYRWYVAPLVLAGAILAGVGSQFVFDAARRIKPRFYRIGLMAVLAAAGLWPVATALQYVDRYAGQPIHPEYQLYTKTGNWLREQTPPDASVGYFEIGYLGYFADRAIIDPVGLVNAGVSDQVAQGNLTWAYRYYQPDYLVIHPIRFYDRIGAIRDEEWFNRAYRPVAQIEQPGYYLNVPLFIYQKVDSAAIPKP